MSIPFVNHKALEVSNCQKCGIAFGQKRVLKVVDSWSGKVVCWKCEKKFREFIHLG